MFQSGVIKKPNRLDLIAAIVCFAVFGYLCYAATVGFGAIDESTYYSIAQRVMMGDRLLIDDWHVSQLSSVLEVFPFWLFTALTGSTEGVILYLRFLFLGVDLIMYWFLYSRLRGYGWLGLLSAALFCAYVPSQILMLNYYTMALHGLLVVCCLLFFGKERKSVFVLVFIGIVGACAVLSEPFLAALYFLWCFLVLFRRLSQKKGKPFMEPYSVFLDGRTWFYITAGIALTAAVFFVFLFSRSPLREIIDTVPEYLTDYEYSVQGVKQGKLIDYGKIFDAMHFFGFFPVVGFLLPVLCLFLRRRGKLGRYRSLLFTAACVCFIGSYLFAAGRMLLYWDQYYFGVRFRMPVIIFYYYFQNLPMLFLGLNCCLLCEKKDPRIFGFLFVGFFASLFTDFSSELVLGTCAAVAFPAMLISLKTVSEELSPHRQAAPEKRERGTEARKKRFRVFASVCVCLLVAWQSVGFYTYGFYHVVENILQVYDRNEATEVLQRGPMKGIRTSAHMNAIYNDLLSDLDVIKNETDGPFYVAGLFPYFYLYTGLPVGSYSTWYVEEESETRQTRYWELHPERRPARIYVPFYIDPYTYTPYRDTEKEKNWGEEKIAFLQTLCDCEVTEGKAGYILRVVGWDTDAVAAVAEGKERGV